MAELGNAALLQNLAAVRKRIADSVQQRTKVSSMQINTKVHGHTSVKLCALESMNFYSCMCTLRAQIVVIL